MRRRTLPLLLGAGLLLAALPLTVSAQQGSFHRQFQVNGPVQLVIHNGAGDVHIRALPGNQVTVDATIHESMGFFFGPDRAAILRVEQQPPVAQDGNTIRIDPEQGDWARHIWIRYTITAPPATAVRAETGSGDLYLTGLQSDARLRTGSGDVHVMSLRGDVDAATGSGDISFGQISGNAAFATGSGDVRGDSVGGHLRVRSGSGDVHVGRIGGGAYAGTGSGTVGLEQVSGSVTAHSGSGDIEIGGSLNGAQQWDLGTGSGEIQVNLGGNSLARAQLHAGSGDIDVHSPNRDTNVSHHSWSGIIGGGSSTPGATLIAHTNSGDITVN
ncbi:MAG: DUF4097 family beta strand repeat-containing protein [Terriglobales bacterium]